MADVVIVGGGVVGCAAAYYLTKAGAGVALLEKGEVGGAASGAAAGMLVPPPWATASGDFRDLCLASLRLYPALVGSLLDETSIDVQYLESGLLVPAESEPAAAALRHPARHTPDHLV